MIKSKSLSSGRRDACPIWIHPTFSSFSSRCLPFPSGHTYAHSYTHAHLHPELLPHGTLCGTYTTPDLWMECSTFPTSSCALLYLENNFSCMTVCTCQVFGETILIPWQVDLIAWDLCFNRTLWISVRQHLPCWVIIYFSLGCPG